MENKEAVKEVLKMAKQEREKLYNKLRSLEATIQYLEGILGVVSNHPTIRDTKLNDINRFRGLSAPKAAEEVLRETGKPLHIDKIMDKMYDGGFDGQPDRKMLYSNLYSTMLKRKSNIFKRIPKKPATFGLVEWDKQREIEMG